MYLVDTNVVSELRRQRPHPAVAEWIRPLSAEQLFLSAVTVGEIQAGIEITREQDRTKANQLEVWLDQVIASYQVLVLDGPVLREWARLMHRQSDTLIQDALIAATAAVHRLTVVTRNVPGFRTVRRHDTQSVSSSGIAVAPAKVSGRGFAALRGAKPAPQVGAPLTGRASRGSGVRALAALRAAVPTGGRRSKPSPRFFSVGDTQFRCASAQRCRPEVGVPSRPRASSLSAIRGFAALRAAVPV